MGQEYCKCVVRINNNTHNYLRVYSNVYEKCTSEYLLPIF